MGIVSLGIWAAIVLSGLGVLAIVLFSLRGLVFGKVELATVIVMVIPVVVFVVLGLIMETWAVAGIWTTIIMGVLAALALLFTGVRGLFA